MELQIEQNRRGPSEIELRVQIPAETVAEQVNEAVQRVMYEAVIPGFRPGRVPRRVVIERFGKAITEETVSKLIQEAYRQALDQTGVDALSPGDMTESAYEAGKPLAFSVSIEVPPEFPLPNLSEITVELLQPKPDDEDVLGALDDLRESRALLKSSSDPVSEDSVIDVEMQELDESGLPLVGRVYRDLRIDLATTRLGADFVTMMLGLQAGNSTRVEATWAARDQSRKKPGKYQVNIGAVYRKEVPPLDEEFARSVNPAFASVDDLKADMHRYLEARAAYQARERMLHTLVDELLRRTEFSVPPRMLDQYLEQIYENRHRGHQEHDDHRHGPEELAKFKDEMRAEAIWNLRWYLLRRRYVTEQALEVTESELQEETERLARIEGRPAEAFRRKLTEEQISRIRNDLRDNKVFAYLQSQVQIVPRVVSLKEFEGRGESRIITQ